MDEHIGGARAKARGLRMAWRTRSAAAFWGLLAPLVLGLAAPIAAQAADAQRCKLQMMEMPVTMVGSRAIATLGINGQQVRMMVDTGAFFSFLTDATAQQLQLRTSSLPYGMKVYGIAGLVDARKTVVKQLQLLNGEVPNVEFIVGGNEPGGGAMGVIGRNLLSFVDAEYDLAHGMIRFFLTVGDCSHTNMAYWADGAPVTAIPLLQEYRTKLPAIKAIAKVNGHDTTVLFDTGATSVLTLSAAKDAGIAEKDMTPGQQMYGAGQGRLKSWTAPVASFELGNETIRNNRLRIGDFDTSSGDMLLGIDFFLSHRIFVSNSQQRMYFTYNGGQVFALNAVDEPAPAPLQAPLPASGPASPASARASATATATPAPPAGDGAVAAAAAAPTTASLSDTQPRDAAAYLRRGAAAAARHDDLQALADLDRACEMDPRSAAAFTRRGAVHEAMKQLALARKDFDTALELDPADSEARLARAWLRAPGERAGALDDLAVLDRALAPQANERRAMAWLYARLHLPVQALTQWSQWIAARPNDIELDVALNARCWARMSLGVELDKALDDCDEAVDRQSGNASFLDSRGWLRLRRGELARALKDYDRALAIRPKNAWSLYGRGIAHTRLGEAQQGAADMEAARKLQPTIDAEVASEGLVATPAPAAPPALATPQQAAPMAVPASASAPLPLPASSVAAGS